MLKEIAEQELNSEIKLIEKESEITQDLTPGSFRYDLNKQKCTFVLYSLPGLKFLVSMPTVNQILQLKTWINETKIANSLAVGDDQLAIMFTVIAGKCYELCDPTNAEVEIDYETLLNSLKLEFIGADMDLFFRCVEQFEIKIHLARLYTRRQNVDEITTRMDQS